MLREVKNVSFERRLTLFGRRYEVLQGGQPLEVGWRRRAFEAIQRGQEVKPVALFGCDGRTYWLFERRVYWEDGQLSGDDVLALVRQRQRRARRTLERAHAALAGEVAEQRRQPIPRAVRLAVFERDGGRCVECGSAFEIQYDHVIPVALGGAGTVENLQILCAPCNQAKGAALR
jgi:5-methylcytosine-specific restriction endonuclease McrA